MNTDSTGISIPGLNLLPQSWQGPVLIILVLAPHVGRAYHALSSGGGLKGVVNGVIFGTNSPKSAPSPSEHTITEPPTAVQ